MSGEQLQIRANTDKRRGPKRTVRSVSFYVDGAEMRVSRGKDGIVIWNVGTITPYGHAIEVTPESRNS